MTKVIILGCGAATGVPSISGNWGRCNPNNPKNIRRRAGVYIEKDNTKILVDTSPDLKNQLWDNNIKLLDAVLYTHTHADHLHGIDDLRGVTRNLKSSLNFYAIKSHIEEIVSRFNYVCSNSYHKDKTKHPELLPNILEYYKDFDLGNLNIVPLKFDGHTIITTGYSFNHGEIVIIPDFKEIPIETLNYLKNIDVNLLIIPLTVPYEAEYHAGIETVLKYISEINPQRAVLTHMAVECDYDEIMFATPENVIPAFDNMIIEI